MPGCNQCKYHTSNMEYNENTPVGTSPFVLSHICMSGNTLKCIQWWKDNGDKSPDTPVDDMSCFKHTRLAEHLMLMDSLLDQMSDVLDSDNTEE